MTTRVTGVDTYAVGNGESYHKSSDGLEADGSPVEVIGSNGMEMTGQRVANEDYVNPEVLEHSIQALENKKTAWWAYLTTRDFWLVLLIGYVHLSAQDPRLIRVQTSPCPLHHCYQHLLFSPLQQGNLYPSLPDSLQLHRALCNLHALHNLPLRL
jgi:hypothetical protein